MSSLLSRCGRCLAGLVAALAASLLLAPVLQAQPISEQGFERIGGIDQWVSIEGADRRNPVLLFLHGGPGNPLSPFASAIYGAWSKEFTLVQWDQRGAGKTFGRNPAQAQAPLSLAQMVDDGLELATLLQRRLGAGQIVLMGSSWGSVLGVHMAQRRPELFLAYIGTAQLVSRQANEAASYAQTLARAEAAGDAAALAQLRAMGPPPRRDPRTVGVLRRLIRQYEAAACEPAPAHWWQPAAAYATPQALEDSEQGEEYSFLQFVGLEGQGILAQVDLPALGTQFKLPMLFVQGEQDLLTPAAVTRAYVDSLQAPAKALVLVPRAGHDPNEAIVAAQYRLLQQALRLPAR